MARRRNRRPATKERLRTREEQNDQAERSDGRAKVAAGLLAAEEDQWTGELAQEECRGP
ncbi:hypothetical protein ABZ580_32490 [Streptomyces sp. NPDC012486]|uniref:hypothetical protein n=1 Tax=unclassified Streptomyces TaxID=2593676 RepID=UPI0033DCCFE9